MTTPYNPYAPPGAPPPIPGYAGGVDEVAIRREHLGTESGLRTFGILQLLGAVLAMGLGLFGLFIVVLDRSGALGNNGGEPMGLFDAVLFGLLCLLAPVSFWVGLGLRRYDPKIRGAATLVAALGLLGFPLGTLINLYFLHLLHGQKGKYVFTPAYHEIIARTPHLRPRTGFLVWLALGLIGLFVVAIVIAFVVGN
jgi:hypothetical protein